VTPGPARACQANGEDLAGDAIGGDHWAGSPAASSPTAPRPSGPFQLAERLGSVNSAAEELARPGRRCARPSVATASACRPQPRGRPPARDRRRPPAHRPVGHPGPGPGVRGPQSQCPPGPSQAGGRAVPVGPPRGAGRHLGRQRGGQAVQRESRPPAHHRAWAIIRRADRSHRLAGQRASRSNRADRTSRSHQPQERAMVADAR